MKHRSLLSHRPAFRVESYADNRKDLEDLSPNEKKTFFIKNAMSNSYASLGSQEGYYKHSASLLALRSLHGMNFFDAPVDDAQDVGSRAMNSLDALSKDEVISPMRPKMVDGQMQTMSHHSSNNMNSTDRGKVQETQGSMNFSQMPVEAFTK